MNTGKPNLFQIAYAAFQAGKLKEANSLLQQWLSLNPNDTNALNLLGIIALRVNNNEQAKKWLESSLSINSKNADTYYYLAIVWTNLKDLNKTVYCLRHSVELNPNRLDATKNLAELLIQNGHLLEASQYLKNIFEREPQNIKTLSDLSYCYLETGNVTEAIDCYNKALTIDQSLSYIRSNLMVALNYYDIEETESIIKKHAKAIEEQAPKLAPIPPRKVDTKRKIKIAYVSADFHNHSVSYFFRPLLDHHDRSRFEIYAYYTNSVVDDFTNRCQKEFDVWREAANLPDKELAELIRGDEIDILIDLTGHMHRNRLAVFAAKPSPIQVTWLGFPNTTGLKAMDYRIVDNTTDPEDDHHYYSEKRLRLPNGFLCYEGPTNAHPTSELPALKNGRFTFGSFNNYTKITPDVIDCWAAILQGKPNSQLAIKSRQLSDPLVQNKLLSDFSSRNIDKERVIVIPPTASLKDHWETYNQIDLALDTFPYNGTTTTCEALWMGVPTVCFAGNNHAARVSASIMKQAGLEQFVASSKEDYVAKSIQWSNDLESLQTIRLDMRAKLKESDLCNGQQFTRNMESAFMAMIDNQCTQK